MSDEATPRPWRCNSKVGYIWGDDKNPKANCQIAVVGGFITDRDLVPWNGKRWSADTELIVRAVNEHDALKAEVERLRAELNRLRPPVVWTEQDVQTWRECLG